MILYMRSQLRLYLNGAVESNQALLTIQILLLLISPYYGLRTYHLELAIELENLSK